MKKFLALLLAVMMIASMSITAFAAEVDADPSDNLYTALQNGTTTDKKSANVDVKITNGDAGITNDTVYYVVVEWKTLEFSFTFDSNSTTAVWNPQNHTYVNSNNTALTGSWQADTNNEITVDTTNNSATMANAIKVENHSNAAIKVSAATKNGTALNGVTTSVVNGTETTIPSADGLAVEADELKWNCSVKVSGVPTLVSGFTVDQVNLTIGAFTETAPTT